MALMLRTLILDQVCQFTVGAATSVLGVRSCSPLPDYDQRSGVGLGASLYRRTISRNVNKRVPLKLIPNPKALRPRVLRFLGPKTILYRAFGQFLSLRETVLQLLFFGILEKRKPVGEPSPKH